MQWSCVMGGWRRWTQAERWRHTKCRRKGCDWWSGISGSSLSPALDVWLLNSGYQFYIIPTQVERPWWPTKSSPNDYRTLWSRKTGWCTIEMLCCHGNRNKGWILRCLTVWFSSLDHYIFMIRGSAIVSLGGDEWRSKHSVVFSWSCGVITPGWLTVQECSNVNCSSHPPCVWFAFKSTLNIDFSLQPVGLTANGNYSKVNHQRTCSILVTRDLIWAWCNIQHDKTILQSYFVAAHSDVWKETKLRI